MILFNKRIITIATHEIGRTDSIFAFNELDKKNAIENNKTEIII